MFVKITGYSIFLDKLKLYVSLNPKFCLSFVNECNTRNTSYHHFEGVAPYILIIPPGKTVHNSSHKTTIRLGFLFLPAPCLFTVATKRRHEKSPTTLWTTQEPPKSLSTTTRSAGGTKCGTCLCRWAGIGKTTQNRVEISRICLKNRTEPFDNNNKKNGHFYRAMSRYSSFREAYFPPKRTERHANRILG